MKDATKLIHLGRPPAQFEGTVNMPVHRASTILSKDIKRSLCWVVNTMWSSVVKSTGERHSLSKDIKRSLCWAPNTVKRLLCWAPNIPCGQVWSSPLVLGQFQLS